MSNKHKKRAFSFKKKISLKPIIMIEKEKSVQHMIKNYIIN